MGWARSLPTTQAKCSGRWWRTATCKCMLWLMLCATSETGHQSPAGWQTARDGEAFVSNLRQSHHSRLHQHLQRCRNPELTWTIQKWRAGSIKTLRTFLKLRRHFQIYRAFMKWSLFLCTWDWSKATVNNYFYYTWLFINDHYCTVVKNTNHSHPEVCLKLAVWSKYQIYYVVKHIKAANGTF